MENFNWQTEFIGKKVINEKGEVGTFINNDNKTFTVNYNNGQGLNAEIGSPLSQGWKLVEEESNWNLLISRTEAKKIFERSLLSVYCDTNKPIINLGGINIYVTSESIEQSLMFKLKTGENYCVGNDYARKENSAEFLKRLGTDGQKWAKEFIKINKEKDIANDEGTMIGWFCNSIMAGMDEQARISKNKLKEFCDGL